jgi:choline kinase
VIALILAAGMGSRMGRLTESVPKPLLRIGRETVIGRLARQCEEAGVTRVVAVTGHLAERIEAQAPQENPGVEWIFVRNDKFKTTNNVASLQIGLDYIARTFGQEPVLLVECDVVLEDGVLGA